MMVCAGMRVQLPKSHSGPTLAPLWPHPFPAVPPRGGTCVPSQLTLWALPLPLLTSCPQVGWQHLAMSLLCPQALRVVCPELLLLPQQGPGLGPAEEEAPGGHRGVSGWSRAWLGGSLCPKTAVAAGGEGGRSGWVNPHSLAQLLWVLSGLPALTIRDSPFSFLSRGL